MRLAVTGMQEVIGDIAAMGTHARGAAREALLKVGRRVRKDLIATAGKTAPVSRLTSVLKAIRKRAPASASREQLKAVARTARPTKPWGKSEWTVRVPRNLLRLTVTTRGANRLMEHGGRVAMSDKLVRFLHLLGYHLRGTSYYVRPRPVFGPVYAARKEAMVSEFRDELFRRLSQRISRWRIG